MHNQIVIIFDQKYRISPTKKSVLNMYIRISLLIKKSIRILQDPKVSPLMIMGMFGVEIGKVCIFYI